MEVCPLRLWHRVTLLECRLHVAQVLRPACKMVGRLNGFAVRHRAGFERLLRKLSKLPAWPAMLYLHVYQPTYMGFSFWKGAEMEMETILQYYNVPTVSARNALFHMTMANVTGFSDDDIHCGVHPNPLGHRCGLLCLSKMQAQMTT